MMPCLAEKPGCELLAPAATSSLHPSNASIGKGDPDTIAPSPRSHANSSPKTSPGELAESLTMFSISSRFGFRTVDVTTSQRTRVVVDALVALSPMFRFLKKAS